MTRALLETRAVSKAFGHFVAVRDVSLALRGGELAALIGPNGAGKTTFYNVVSGRLKPTSGRVLFDGRDITGLAPERIARLGVSRSFQITNIFADLTVLENVAVALVALRHKGLYLWESMSRDRDIEARALALLERLGLAEHARLRAGTLSHGDKRLLELAIVLAIAPRLVLLDEPTAGLTPEETRHVTRLIRGLAEEGPYTFFLTEHDMDVVFDLAERVFVMHRGELLAEGAPAEIRADRDVRSAYLGEELA